MCGSACLEVFDELFGNDEVPKIALAANLGYHADDPRRLWWLYYAIAQGGYLAGGGAYIRGGSRTLERAAGRAWWRRKGVRRIRAAP